jgi:hypothetical protein
MGVTTSFIAVPVMLVHGSQVVPEGLRVARSHGSTVVNELRLIDRDAGTNDGTPEA